MENTHENENKKIRVLDFEVANLIAAGEVVDRPASVIKELIENAIDSGATVITTEIQRGGITYMRVTDNGCGIDFADLPTAILRHATSKIHSAKDLDGILTLGFRGEALAAIASVSELRIISRPEYSELGGLLHAEGGEIVEYCETGCSVGTSVIVEELFANVPARRKFLKKDASETAAVTAIVERIALSRPDISFRLITDGVMRLRTEGNGDLKGAIYSVLGRAFWSRTIPVSAENGGVSVSGFIGMPDTARANRNGQIFFINGRSIRSKTAQAAIEQAYNTYIPPDRFAACVLSIDVAPDTVDVNVHPAKLEVKFSNEKLIFETIYYAVRPALETKLTISELKLDDKKTGGVSNEYLRKAEKTANAFVPIRDGTPTPKTETIRFTEPSVSDSERPILGNVSPRTSDSSYPLRGSAKDSFFTSYFPKPSKETSAPYISPRTEEKKDSNTNVNAHSSENIAPNRRGEAFQNRSFEPEIFPNTEDPKPENKAAEKKVSDEKASSASAVPEYRIIGEAFNCYIIVEVDNKLILIDKHAAHERILYERLRRNMRENTKDSASQMLLVPIKFSLTPNESAVISEYADDIHSAGFDFSFDGDEITVTALPHNFTSDSVTEIFQVFADGLRTTPGETRDMIFERTLYTCACKAAIKAGRIYGAEHIKWLCDEIFRIPNIKYCPHGRPVALELTHSQLDRHFKRLG